MLSRNKNLYKIFIVAHYKSVQKISGTFMQDRVRKLEYLLFQRI